MLWSATTDFSIWYIFVRHVCSLDLILMACPACPTYTMSHSHGLNSYTAYAMKMWQCTLDRWETPPAMWQDVKYHVRVRHAQLLHGLFRQDHHDNLDQSQHFNTDLGFKISHSWCLAIYMLQQDIAVKLPSGRRNNDTYQPVVIRLSTTDCHNHLSSYEQSEELNSELQDHSVDEKCWTWTPQW